MTFYTPWVLWVLRMCSGRTSNGLKDKIRSWADVHTRCMGGGNDDNFLLKCCLEKNIDNFVGFWEPRTALYWCFSGSWGEIRFLRGATTRPPPYKKFSRILTLYEVCTSSRSSLKIDLCKKKCKNVEKSHFSSLAKGSKRVLKI